MLWQVGNADHFLSNLLLTPIAFPPKSALCEEYIWSYYTDLPSYAIACLEKKYLVSGFSKTKYPFTY